MELPFRDRGAAGRLLGEELKRRSVSQNELVLALPRGGVPIGYEVAKILGVPLDVMVVRKLGFPGQPELAMGAVGNGGVRVLDEKLVRELGIFSRNQVERIAAREALEVERREQLYRAGRPALNLRGRRVALVDDGLATGSTMLAAIECTRRLGAATVTVAVPVASRPASDRMREAAGGFVCLAEPEPFHAVGEWYLDFRQTTDEMVTKLLEPLR